MSQSKPLSPGSLLLNSIAMVAVAAIVAHHDPRPAVSPFGQNPTASASPAPRLEKILRLAKLQIQNWQRNHS